MAYEELVPEGQGENGHSDGVSPSYREVGLSDILEGGEFELQGVTDSGAVLVTERREAIRELAESQKEQLSPKEAQNQISGSGETLYRRTIQTDYNPELAGRRGIDKYREMRNDSVVRTTLKLQKNPILAARWFMQPASQLPEDQAKASFVWDNLTKWMTMSWPQFLVEALLMCDYGVYAFEKVFIYKQWMNPVTNATEEKLVWRKFAPIPPYEIAEFEYDDEGGPAAILVETETDPKRLDILKSLIFTYDKEAGDLWGISVLRSAYKHWFYKEQLYKIDAIQKERHGIGIPIIKLPTNWEPNDKLAAERIGQNLRTNESAHVVLPTGWDVMFLKLEGQRVDALESAQHHAEKLYENVLANFMVTNGDTGAITALEAVHTKSARFIAEIVRDVINSYAIPQLMLLNFPEEEMPNGYPQLKVRRLGDERDWRTISFAIRNFIGAKAMMVDDPLRHWIREEMDLPIEDPETAFYVDDSGEQDGEEDDPKVKPDLDKPKAGRAGLPRQKRTPTSGGTPDANAGTDRSGG